MTKIYKRSGFKDTGGNFWSNDKSTYGMRYQCKGCGRVALGWRGADDRAHHVSADCPVLVAATAARSQQ